MKYLLLIVLFIVSGCSRPKYSSYGDIEVKLHQLHIDKRGSIEINWLLEDAAKKHANWMALNELSHTGENGSFVSDRVQYRKWTIIAENIAYGQNTADEVMKSWMKSSGHRQNILNKKFTYMGIGTATDKSGRIYWCVVFSD